MRFCVKHLMGLGLLLVGMWCLNSSFEAAPNNNEPQTAAELGKLLFFDTILSANGSVSCSSCHRPDFAFADTTAFSVGVGGKHTRRNAPAVTNMSERTAFFWDGRVRSLAEQALHPIANADEMNLPISQAVQRLRKHPQYNTWFKRIMGKQVNGTLLGEAIAAYERTLETSYTPWDLYATERDTTLVSEAAKRGSILFRNKAACTECHFTPDFTGDEFRNIGLYDAQKYTDSGRFGVTADSADLGKFKVPSLRNVGVTAPYMHDGSMATLEAVVDYYNNPQQVVPHAINRDTTLAHPLLLSDTEKQDLVAFLHTLTDLRFVKK